MIEQPDPGLDQLRDLHSKVRALILVPTDCLVKHSTRRCLGYHIARRHDRDKSGLCHTSLALHINARVQLLQQYHRVFASLAFRLETSQVAF